MRIQGLLILLFLLPSEAVVAAEVGICYGRVGNNIPPALEVINILKANGITKVRIFDADPLTLNTFSGTRINLMIGVPNEILPSLASDGTPTFALNWLQTNILAHISPTQIRYIAVGNEVFLKQPYYSPYVVPAIVNLHQALQTLNLDATIKLSSPQAASVLSTSYPPSLGTFDPSLRSTLLPLLSFLRDTKSPFMVNVYPYFSYTGSLKHVPLDYALFRSQQTVQDGMLMYDNLFDASVDAVLYAMEREGFTEMPLVVSETGWPKDGDVAASVENALAYNENVMKRVSSNFGTPKRPGVGIEVYLFDLFDENGKGGNECEKHFGIFGPDGVKAYGLTFN